LDTDDLATVADQEVDAPVRCGQLRTRPPEVLYGAADKIVGWLIGPGSEERHLLRRVHAAQRQRGQFVEARVVVGAQRQTGSA
jgi:hypothetical protein